jgi:hypothetical protein
MSGLRRLRSLILALRVRLIGPQEYLMAKGPSMLTMSPLIRDSWQLIWTHPGDLGDLGRSRGDLGDLIPISWKSLDLNLRIRVLAGGAVKTGGSVAQVRTLPDMGEPGPTSANLRRPYEHIRQDLSYLWGLRTDLGDLGKSLNLKSRMRL